MQSGPVEPARHWGGEHNRVAEMFGVFLKQQADGFLWQENRPHRIGGFGLGYLYLTVDASSRLVYRQGLGFRVKVIPEDGYQLAPSDACGQFQVEHGEEAMLVRRSEVGIELMTMDELTTMSRDKCILQLRGLRPFFSPNAMLQAENKERYPEYKQARENDRTAHLQKQCGANFGHNGEREKS